MNIFWQGFEKRAVSLAFLRKRIRGGIRTRGEGVVEGNVEESLKSLGHHEASQDKMLSRIHRVKENEVPDYHWKDMYPKNLVAIRDHRIGSGHPDYTYRDMIKRHVGDITRSTPKNKLKKAR